MEDEAESGEEEGEEEEAENKDVITISWQGHKPTLKLWTFFRTWERACSFIVVLHVLMYREGRRVRWRIQERLFKFMHGFLS